MGSEKKDLARKIVEGLGGAENIVTFENCMTRLRIIVKDGGKVDREALTREKEIMGVIGKETELQIILGPGAAESIGKAAEGKEPKAAVYAVRDAIDGRSDEVMNAMRSDLTEEDIQKVEDSIAAVTDALSAAEEKCKAAIAEAETQAREYLAALRAARENAE